MLRAAHLWQMCDNIINHRVCDAIRPGRRICAEAKARFTPLHRARAPGILHIVSFWTPSELTQSKSVDSGAEIEATSTSMHAVASPFSLHFSIHAIRYTEYGACVFRRRCVGVYAARTLTHDAQRVVCERTTCYGNSRHRTE